mmetsp:Transcript_50813/g.135603  ORF Transcript_50813/g.135603 Transcript_50813/m.135603 type:complete len:243 (+) Transcript_50813:984-1712(+)
MINVLVPTNEGDENGHGSAHDEHERYHDEPHGIVPREQVRIAPSWVLQQEVEGWILTKLGSGNQDCAKTDWEKRVTHHQLHRDDRQERRGQGPMLVQEWKAALDRREPCVVKGRGREEQCCPSRSIHVLLRVVPSSRHEQHPVQQPAYHLHDDVICHDDAHEVSHCEVLHGLHNTGSQRLAQLSALPNLHSALPTVRPSAENDGKEIHQHWAAGDDVQPDDDLRAELCSSEIHCAEARHGSS